MIQDNERNIYFQSHASQDPIGILLRSHGLQASVLRSSVSNPQVMAGFPEYSNETMADKLGGRLIRKLVSLSMSAVRSDARFAGTTGRHCCDPCLSHWRDSRPTQKLYQSKQSTQSKHSEECKQINRSNTRSTTIE